MSLPVQSHASALATPQSVSNSTQSARVAGYEAFKFYTLRWLGREYRTDVPLEFWPVRFTSIDTLLATSHHGYWCQQDVTALHILRKFFKLSWGFIASIFFPHRLVCDCKWAYNTYVSWEPGLDPDGNLKPGAGFYGTNFLVTASDARVPHACSNVFTSRQELSDDVRPVFEEALLTTRLLNHRSRLIETLPGLTDLQKIELLIDMSCWAWPTYLSSTAEFRRYPDAGPTPRSLEDNQFLSFIHQRTAMPLGDILQHFFPRHEQHADSNMLASASAIQARPDIEDRGPFAPEAEQSPITPVPPTGAPPSTKYQPAKQLGVSLLEETGASNTPSTDRRPLGAPPVTKNQPALEGSRQFDAEMIAAIPRPPGPAPRSTKKRAAEEDLDNSEDVETQQSPTKRHLPTRARPLSAAADRSQRPCKKLVSRVNSAASDGTRRSTRILKLVSSAASPASADRHRKASKQSASRMNTATSDNSSGAEKQKGAWSLNDQRILVEELLRRKTLGLPQEFTGEEYDRLENILLPYKSKKVMMNKMNWVWENVGENYEKLLTQIKKALAEDPYEDMDEDMDRDLNKAPEAQPTPCASSPKTTANRRTNPPRKSTSLMSSAISDDAHSSIQTPKQPAPRISSATSGSARRPTRVSSAMSDNAGCLEEPIGPWTLDELRVFITELIHRQSQPLGASEYLQSPEIDRLRTLLPHKTAKNIRGKYHAIMVKWRGRLERYLEQIQATLDNDF